MIKIFQFDTKEPSLRFQDLKENENEEDTLISESNDDTLPRSSKKDRIKYRTNFLNNLWNYGLKMHLLRLNMKYMHLNKHKLIRKRVPYMIENYVFNY